MNHDFDLYSPIGGHADEEESTFLSDVVTALVVFECFMYASYLIANTLFG
jgi:hypothetical protein